MVTKQRNTPKTAVAGVVPVNGNILLTKWTAPDPVTKQLSLSPNGTVQKTSTASQLYEGKVMQVECTPSEFIDVLNSIGSNDCLSYGIPLDANVTHVLSKKKFQNSGAPSGVTTRTADKMDWPKGPAILMIDYDPNETELYTPKKLLDTIYQCCPAIRSVAHIHAASASSCLWNSNTRQQVKGMEGQRVYIIVADGTDIPRASEVLFKRTWLNGHGYIKISSAGSMLVRSIIDDSVFQPNRIDYCAPPICTAPLESRKPKPKLWGKATLVLDTRTALPELTPEEESRYNQLVDTAKSSAKVPAAAKRAEYQGKRVDEMVAQGSTRETAEKVVGDMLDKKVLHGDVVLHATDGQIVTVRDILLNKSIWHGKTFADPAEPDYHNDNRIARAYLNGPGQSRIHSFAHGGCTYTLSVTVATIRLQKGERHEYMRQIVHTLRDYQEFYRRDSSLVAIGDDGSMIMVTPLMVLASLDRLIRFEKGLNKNWCAADAPLDAAKMLIEAYATEFPPIKAVLTAPIIDPESGRLLAQSGYDARTGADLFLPDDVASIPESPDLEAVNEAIGILWWPVRYFPFDSPIDQTVMFTAMLTAVMRALLPTAPGFGFDAPIQASGKTLLIKVLATLKGDSPTISPQPDARSDEEMRKRVFAVLLTGSGTIVIDNIIGEFDSPSLAAALTSEHYSDRVLGKSRSETVPTNALVLVSGNNLILKGDLPRRILKCRIDPRTETPHQREFHFDPVEVIRENRQQLVAAALTLIRAYLQQKPVERIGAGRMASFEIWDDMVRQTICWLASLQRQQHIPIGETSDGIIFPQLTDPMDAVSDAVRDDPARSQHGRLLNAWANEIGTGQSRNTALTIKELVAKAAPPQFSVNRSAEDDDDALSLYDILFELAGGNPVTQTINGKRLGKILSQYKDRITDGLCLRWGEKRQGALTWWIEALRGCGEFRELNSSHMREESTSNKPRTTVKQLTQTTKPTRLSAVPITPKRRQA